MKYTGQFHCGYKGDKVLTLRLTTPTEGADVALTLGASPFTTSMSTGEKMLYEPAKYEAATVNLIVGEYLFDLYSGKAQDTKVELLDDAGKVLWTGYADPTMYNQRFVHQREEVSINCSCALASLQYLKHKSADKSAAVSMAALLARTLKRCNAYTHFYVPTNISMPNAAADPFTSCIISEENFFDKRDDPKQTDDDLAWTCRDVLEEICRYFGLTACAQGEAVLLLDYDALATGDTEVWGYDVATGTCQGTTTLAELGMAATVPITQSSHAAADSNLSLEKVYNKVKVIDEFYKMDDVTIDPFDLNALHNITAESDACGVAGSGGASLDPKKGALLDVCNLRLTDDEQVAGRAQRLFDSIYKVKEDKWNDPNLVVLRFLNSDNVDLHAYNVSTDGVPTPRSYPSTLGWTDAKGFCGAALAYFSVQAIAYEFMRSISKDGSKERIANPYECSEDDHRTLLIKMRRPETNYNTDQYNWDGTWANNWLKGEWVTESELRQTASNVEAVHEAAAARLGLRSLSVSPYICLFNPAKAHISQAQNYDKLPFFSIKSHKVRGGFAGGPEAYLIISGSFIWQYDQDQGIEEGWSQNPYPVPNGQIDPIGRRKKLDRNFMYIPANECWTYAFLRHGGRSWDGSTWVNDPDGNVFFKLWYFEADADNEHRNVPQSISTEMPIRNTIDYTMGLSGKSGTAIPLPADWGILEATPQFGLCKPHDPKLWYRQDEGPHFYTFDRVFVKDLKLEVAVGGALDRDVNSDTQFTNIIDDANAVELSDIKLRITTYDQKKLSFSNVAVRTAAGVAFLGRWINKALKQKELSWIYDNGEYASATDGLCSEEHLVFKLVNQYSKPAKTLSLSIHGAAASLANIYTSAHFPDSKMVVTSVNRDWRADAATLKITEKF